ncbi:asparagine synthase C-terminal domain-containing protein [Terricaulis sp.]|uniref:asparagine synthase C-terminal domain-containing protein n=1 Tax=Terricaulis sp. TaxID=2768686 RepID=UPI002AC62284|nr:asparagine synthase C-terminal domain-containing protein [Terricaulis sp.]MDZ4690968.1 asparagine synthase C-terminal domain-containing protein [Terricaulis sp.]
MRFVGLRWTPGSREQTRAARTIAAALGDGWTTLIDWRGLLLLHLNESQVEILPHGMGVVFGDRYGDGPDPSPPSDVALDPTPGWIAARWGAYVAVLIDRGYDLVRVLRDPSGAVSCFLAEAAGVHLFFGDARDYVAICEAPAADLGFMRAFLRYPLYLERRTGLAGVEDLWPGEAAIFPRNGRRLDRYWTPHLFSRGTPKLDWAAGRVALRANAEEAVGAQARRHARIALRLSGGFDSSLVLALLRRTSEAEIVCVNEYWEGAPEGDERAQAKAVANVFGAPCHDLRIDPATVDYAGALSAPLSARPSLALLSFGNPGIARFYANLGCTVITSGQGGDHLFHRSRTPWIAADAIRDGVTGARAMQIALDTARLTGAPVWDVLATMALGAVHARPRARHRSEVLGVLTEGSEAAHDHVWEAEARSASPARGLRIRQLLDALSYHDETSLSAAAPTRPFLLAQPVIETCLSIAPYVITQGGTERALARAAFGDLLPDSVTRRTTKGETTRYFAAVLSNNWDWIREVLIDGRLVDSGVADGAAMRRALRRDWRQDGLAADVLYALIAGECWLRNLDRTISEAKVLRTSRATADVPADGGAHTHQSGDS